MGERFVFRILMLGDAGVGKTSLLQRFINKRYTGAYKSTIGMETRERIIEISGWKIKLEIWDTAGEERYRSLMSSYYRKIDGVVLVFDTTKRSSYGHVAYWLDEIKRHTVSDVDIILVGNKCEAFVTRQVMQQAAVMFADSLEIPYLEASALSGYNVDRVFSKLAANVYDRRILEEKTATIPRGGIRLRDDTRLTARRSLTGRLRGFCC